MAKNTFMEPHSGMAPIILQKLTSQFGGCLAAMALRINFFLAVLDPDTNKVVISVELKLMD